MNRNTAAVKRYLGTHEVARLLSVDAGTVIRWVDAGRFASFRTPGGHRRIPRQEVLRFAEQHGWLLSGTFPAEAPAPEGKP